MSNSKGDPLDAGEEKAREAVQAAADAERLLPGEDPASADPRDAARWVDVYSELLTLKQELLRLVLTRLAEVRQELARREVEETDLVVIRAEAERLARRLDFWRQRHDELR